MRILVAACISRDGVQGAMYASTLTGFEEKPFYGVSFTHLNPALTRFFQDQFHTSLVNVVFQLVN